MASAMLVIQGLPSHRVKEDPVDMLLQDRESEVLQLLSHLRVQLSKLHRLG